MIQLFAGYEAAEAVGFQVFSHSVIERATAPVSITPLASMGLPKGSNSFTMSRFLIPSLMGHRGHAIFADGSDMLMLGDVAALDALFDPRYAVQVVRHADYQTRHPVKYRGTALECDNRNYSRKNWASLMIVNCEHPLLQGLWSPERLAEGMPLSFLQFGGIEDSAIGALPDEWNVLIDEGQEGEGAKVLHWTAGIPAFPMYRQAPAWREWSKEFDKMTAVLRG